MVRWLALAATLSLQGCAGDPLAWWLAPARPNRQCVGLSAEQCTWREGSGPKQEAEQKVAQTRNDPVEREARWLRALDRWLDRVLQVLGGGLSLAAMQESAQVICAGAPKLSGEGESLWSCEAHRDLAWRNGPAILEFDGDGLLALTWIDMNQVDLEQRLAMLRERWQAKCETGNFVAAIGGSDRKVDDFWGQSLASLDDEENVNGLGTVDEERGVFAGSSSFQGEIFRCATTGGPVLALARFPGRAESTSHFSVVVFAIGE
jgi:hypothetical protein